MDRTSLELEPHTHLCNFDGVDDRYRLDLRADPEAWCSGWKVGVGCEPTWGGVSAHVAAQNLFVI